MANLRFVTCEKCHVPHYFRRAKATDPDPRELPAEELHQRLRSIGWRSAKDLSRVICCDCFNAPRGVRSQKNYPLPPLAPLPPEPQTMEPPPLPDPGAATNMRIFRSLDDHYIPGSGYIDNWSDARIAQDLHVARYWVAECRRKYFGADVSERLLNEVAAIGVQLREVVELTDRLRLRLTEAEKQLGVA
jgi:hypothetical protein